MESVHLDQMEKFKGGGGGGDWSSIQSYLFCFSSYGSTGMVMIGSKHVPEATNQSCCLGF